MIINNLEQIEIYVKKIYTIFLFFKDGQFIRGEADGYGKLRIYD